MRQANTLTLRMNKESIKDNPEVKLNVENTFRMTIDEISETSSQNLQLFNDEQDPYAETSTEMEMVRFMHTMKNWHHLIF